MKRFIIIMLVLVGALMSFGCEKSEKVSSDKENDIIEIKLLHSWPRPELNKYFEDVASEFEKVHPNVKIKIEAAGDEAIKDKLRIMMGTDSQPDIFFSWSGEFATKFVRSENALDLTKAFENDPAWKKRIMVSAIEPYTYDGKIYGVPLRTNAKFFVYRKDIFNKLNLNEPKTWTEFLDVCEAIKKDGIAPIALGNIYPWAGSHFLTGMNQKFVSEEVRKEDYKPSGGKFEDAGYIKALEALKELADKGYFNKGFNSTEHNMALEFFYNGKAAMTYIELIEFTDVEKDIKDSEWGFFPMPAVEEGKGNQNFLTGAPDGFMISANTKYPDEATEFLKFLTTKEMSEKMVVETGWPSSVVGSVNKDNAPDFLIAGMEAVNKAEGMALWIDTDINIKIADVYLTGLQEVLNDTKSPEELMKEVRETAKRVREELK